MDDAAADAQAEARNHVRQNLAAMAREWRAGADPIDRAMTKALLGELADAIEGKGLCA